DDRDRLEQRQAAGQLLDGRLGEAADEVHGAALDLLDDDGDVGSLHGGGVKLGQGLLEPPHRLAACRNLADQREGDLAVGPDEHDLVQVLVVPYLDLENVRGPDHVRLVRAVN